MIEIEHVIRQAWQEPFTVKSDFAREFALSIAAAASDGLITTKTLMDTEHGSKWLPTSDGLRLLEEMANCGF